MKNNRTIIAAAAAIAVIAAAGVGFWQIQKSKTAKKLKDDTVTVEVEGYGVAFTAVMPKDKFNYEIDETHSDKPAPYPRLRAKSKDDTYKLLFEIERGSSRYNKTDYESRQKEKDFKDIKGDEKKGILKGYSYRQSTAIRTVLYLKERDDKIYRLNVYVSDIKEPKEKSLDVYNQSEVQDLISSIRAVDNYKAPERDYMLNNIGNIVVKKAIPQEIDGFKVKYEPRDSFYFEIAAEKGPKNRVSLELYGTIYERDLAKTVSEDYEVKSGKRQYSEKKQLANCDLAIDLNPAPYGTSKRLYFYAHKNGKTFKGSMIFADGDRPVAEKLLEETIKNAEFYAKP